MAQFDFTLDDGVAVVRRRVESSDVVAATRAVHAQWPGAQVLACVEVHDVLWAVREVEAHARAH